MRTNIIEVGNSKGIRIPKAILEQCHIKKEVFLQVEDNNVIISPVKKKPRTGWVQYFKKMRENNEDRLIIEDKTELEMEDWEW